MHFHTYKKMMKKKKKIKVIRVAASDLGIKEIIRNLVWFDFLPRCTSNNEVIIRMNI